MANSALTRSIIKRLSEGPVTASDWALADPQLGEDMRNVLSEGLTDKSGLNRAFNSPKATDNLIGRYFKNKGTPSVTDSFLKNFSTQESIGPEFSPYEGPQQPSFDFNKPEVKKPVVPRNIDLDDILSNDMDAPSYGDNSSKAPSFRSDNPISSNVEDLDDELLNKLNKENLSNQAKEARNTFRQAQQDKIFENLQKSSMTSEGSNFSKFDDAVKNAQKMRDLDDALKDPISKFDKLKLKLHELKYNPGKMFSKAGDKFDDMVSQLSKSELLKKYGPMGSKAIGAAGAAVEGHAAGGDFSDVIDGEQSLQEKIGKGLQGTGKSVKGAASLMGAASLPAVVPTGGMAAMPAMLTALAGQTLDTAGQVIESPTGYTPKQVKDITKGAAGFLANQNKINPNAKTMGEFMKQPVSTPPTIAPDQYDKKDPFPSFDIDRINKLTEEARVPASVSSGEEGVAKKKETTKTPSKEEVAQYKSYINDVVKKESLPSDLVLGMFDQESSFNPYLVSKTGAKGLGQMFPDAFTDVKEAFPDKYKNMSYEDLVNPTNWKKQVDAAVDFLKLKLKQTGGDEAKAIYRYYGPQPTPASREAAKKHVNDVMQKRLKYSSGEDKDASMAMNRSPSSVDAPTDVVEAEAPKNAVNAADLITSLKSGSLNPQGGQDLLNLLKGNVAPKKAPFGVLNPEANELATKSNENAEELSRMSNYLTKNGPGLDFGPYSVDRKNDYESFLNKQQALDKLKTALTATPTTDVSPDSDTGMDSDIPSGEDSETDAQTRALEERIALERDLNANQQNMMDRALQAANNNRLIAGLGKAGAMIGHGIAGLGAGAILRPDLSGYEALEKQANVPVEMAEKATEYQKDDPNSTASKEIAKMANSLAKDIGVNADMSGMSYNQIVKIFPVLDTHSRAKEATEIRKDAAKEKVETKFNQDFNKLYAAKADKINTLITGSRNGIGKAYSLRLLSERAKTLLDKYRGNFDKMPSKQFAELPRILDAMLSQGQATIAGMNALEQKTLMRKIAELKDFLGNKPNPAKLGKFIENYDDLIDRELKTATSQVDKFVSNLYHDFPRQYRDNPEFDDQIKELISSKLSGDALQNPELDKKVREYLSENAQEIINQKALSGAPSDTKSSAPKSAKIKVMAPNGQVSEISREQYERVNAALQKSGKQLKVLEQ